ncbi:MAG: hypothetical protein HQM06_13115 [Magnetococcales bacterium]|nr:hypothetical protein [Magnetococcales bacterium]
MGFCLFILLKFKDIIMLLAAVCPCWQEMETGGCGQSWELFAARSLPEWHFIPGEQARGRRQFFPH